MVTALSPQEELDVRMQTRNHSRIRYLRIFAEKLLHLQGLYMPLDLHDQSSPPLLSDVRFENSLKSFSLHDPDALSGLGHDGEALRRLAL
jgi:hypothetical protein